MRDIYKTVMIEGDDRVHIVDSYDAEKSGISYMLCGVSNSTRVDYRNPNRIITEVNEDPICFRQVLLNVLIQQQKMRGISKDIIFTVLTVTYLRKLEKFQKIGYLKLIG